MDKILAIQQGDTIAFAQAFDMYYKKTFGFFMNRTQKNRELCKELTQLTYIKLWQGRHTLSQQHPLEKQLFIMAKYTLIDYMRRQASQRKTTAAVVQAGPLTATAEAACEAQATQFETNDYISSLLKKLPPTRQKVLQLKYLYGYSNKEIASQLSVSIKTVEDHVTKGLSQLRTHTALPAAFILFFVTILPLPTIVN